MEMETTRYVQAVLALVIVLGLVVVVAWALRRYALGGMMPLPGRRKRLSVTEMVVLDPRHRAVLLRRDDREHLVVLGQGSVEVIERDIRMAAEAAPEGEA